jgi:hypothetical protein
MGVFATRRVRAPRFTAQAQAFGAILFAFAVLFPAESEAHVGLQQTEFRKDCTVHLLPARAWTRGVGTCVDQIAAVILPQRLMISGKVGEALAAALYCRTGSAMMQFTRKAPACLPLPSPPQRLLSAASNEFAEWPVDRLTPAAAQGLTEAFAFGHPPDG